MLDVHDLHVWEVTSGFPALSAHILVDRSHDCHERRETIAVLLRERYQVDHATLQIDHPAATIMPPESLKQRLSGSDPTSEQH